MSSTKTIVTNVATANTYYIKYGFCVGIGVASFVRSHQELSCIHDHSFHVVNCIYQPANMHAQINLFSNTHMNDNYIPYVQKLTAPNIFLVPV